MTIHEVKKLVIDPGGFAELQVDRVRGDLRRKISRKKVANSALVDGLRKNNVYPAGCKFVATQGKMTAYVIEQMPQVRNVQWDFFSQGSWKKVVQEGCLRKFGLTNADTNRNRFSLAFPFIVFVVLFNGPQICNFFVFFRNEPLRSLNDHLLRPCITNQHDTYAMCIDIVPSRQGMTKAMLAEEQIDVFWNSSFNKDLPTHFLSYSSTTELKSIWHWEYWSRVDPFWPLRKNWSRCKHVLGTRIEYMFSRWIKLEEGRSVFQIFEKQVQAADEYQEGVVGQDTGELYFCPAASIRLGQDIIRIGDKLMASLSLEGINRGRTYEIEYFFEPAEDGTRHVKFVDLTEPVAIGISSLNNFSIKSRSKKIGTVESVEIDGAQIGIGTRFFSSNRYDFLNLAERHHYTIAGIRVDEDGDISVIIDGFDQPVYITYDGGKLHPSIKFLIPRFTGGTLSYSETSLSVGQSVKIDGRAVRVENIAQVGTEYQASFSGDDEPRTVLSNGEWQIRFTEFTFEYTDSKVIFDENSLEFGQSDHLLVTGAETPLALGGLYRILGITPNQDDNAQPFDLDIILEYANEPIPVIREGKWVFAGLEPVRLSYKAAGDTLVRGTKLRAINDKIGGVFCGDVFEIHCFGNTLEYPEIQEIIFTDGQSIPFSKQTLKSFEYCPDGNDFKGIPSHVCSDLPQISFNLRRDHRYKQGDRVKYIGSDTGRFSGLLGTIHRDSDGYDARVVFDKFKDEGHRGVMCGNIKAVAFPLKIGFKFVSLELFEGGLAFRRHDGSITPCPAELVAECKGAKGEVVAKDIHGQDIRLGDFVCLQRAGYPDGKGAPGIVINRERDRWHGDYFHVFYGRDVSGGSFSQTSRWDIRFNNQAMKKQVDMVFIKNCERLDVVSVPTPEPTELEVGDFVRVKDGVTPSCGWAGVSPDEVGRIIEIDEGDAVVDFAGNNEWIGSLDEFEIVDQPLAVGDSVRVRRDVTPHYGWGLASSEHSGRVKNVVNGVVVIDFPHHPDWSAKRSDVEYTPKRSST